MKFSYLLPNFSSHIKDCPLAAPPASEQATLRHIRCSAYRCFLPDLTRFTDSYCTEPETAPSEAAKGQSISPVYYTDKPAESQPDFPPTAMSRAFFPQNLLFRIQPSHKLRQNPRPLFGLTRSGNRFSDRLNSPLRIGKGTVFFREAGCRENHIG